ncbi:MAG TPA: hypothetical protein VH062_34400 [Polyangiaceae bacterium]|jgi:hypothetical protein|nr:hypothetical protein [Polyangiaceae bacterium]
MKTSENNKASKINAYGTAFTALACLVLAAGCGSDGSAAGGENEKPGSAGAGVLKGTIGANGGELVGEVGSALEGVKLTVPAGALSADTEIEIRPAASTKALPATAVECGPEFEISPKGLALAVPATVTLPFDEETVTNNYRFDDEVKAWVLDGEKWAQRLQTESSQGSVVVELDSLTTLSAGVNPPADEDLVKFDLHPNPKFTSCFAQYPDDPKKQPVVNAVVVRGSQNDGLFLSGKNFKPGMQFDMFTVEQSSLLADATVDPNFKNFGLAWYQSDLEASDKGRIYANVRTILLDQIFGFDPRVSLAPTSTFQVGFWFNDPNDAAACGFDVTKPTPFNGEHKAGPLAMITVPDADSGLGPLCTKPNTSTTPATCDP